MTEGSTFTPDPELARSLADYRHLRERIERSILPMATSVDGSWFRFQASLHGLELRRGGYVVLDGPAGQRLGQVTDLRAESQAAGMDAFTPTVSGLRLRLATGDGIVLEGDGRPFHDAGVRPATSAEVAAWLARTRSRRAALEVGDLVLAPGVPAALDSGGLGRHTFMCGQSGSGKTYSLGVLLERVLAETRLRVVVLDPNSDYVGLGRLRGDLDQATAGHFASLGRDVAVWSDDEPADHPLRLRFADLDPGLQAAVLGLDPMRDRDEYAVLIDLLRMQRSGQPLVREIGELLDTDTPGARELGLRARNLGVLEWKVWDPTQPSLVGELRAPTARCAVVDLGSLDTLQEQRLVAHAVLSTLWDARLARQPCLVVIDEAHNICPAVTTDAITALSAEKAVQIAAEGRKYGLYLLTSTQRPAKVHENVVSQCDNLLLMRMNSAADLAELGQQLSFVPQGLMAGATSFRMGQALVAGKVLPQPAYVQMGRRVTEEGGADVPATWATGGQM